MTTRHDVSGVPLQGGYVAKQCPVRAQNDALRPCEPLPTSPALERRFALGRGFEVEIFDQLVSERSDAVRITADKADERQSATHTAMSQGAPLILGGRLPPDMKGRRVGEPDLLVRVDTSGSPRYRAVDVKHHRTLGTFVKRVARLSPLTDPRFEASIEDPERSPRKRRGDLLQLAHYQRMLEAAGMSAEGGRWGGIVGTEGEIVWYDLDDLIWQTPSSSAKRKMRSTMEIYDFEFDFRLDIIAIANQHLSDPSIDPLLVPVKIGECGECPWWSHCGPNLEAGNGDVSLVPRIGWQEWKALHENGVQDRGQLAELDHRTATLIAGGVDVPSLLDAAGSSAPDTPVSELIGGNRPAKLAFLEKAGILTARDVMTLSPRTADLFGARLTSLPNYIDLARASLGSEPVYRRRGVAELVIPRADIEVDLDLENTEDGVYLWGALVTDRSGLWIQEGYRAFVTWEHLTAEEEIANFREMWQWLSELRRRVHDESRTICVYCYHEAVEAGQSRRLAAGSPLEDEVEELVLSSEWVDMLKVFTSQLITGGGNGLKTVAPLAGHNWSVEDAGGEDSMLRYDLAVNAEDTRERDEARKWLLDYNRDDVAATLVLRDWLESEGAAFKGVEDAL